MESIYLFDSLEQISHFLKFPHVSWCCHFQSYMIELLYRLRFHALLPMPPAPIIYSPVKVSPAPVSSQPSASEQLPAMPLTNFAMDDGKFASCSFSLTNYHIHTATHCHSLYLMLKTSLQLCWVKLTNASRWRLLSWVQMLRNIPL